MTKSNLERKTDDNVQRVQFTARADPDEIMAFDAALGGSGRTPSFPLTYPIRWLMRPEIREAVGFTIGPQPIHVSQSFEYMTPLDIGADYRIQITIQPDGAPSQRVTLRGAAYGQNDQLVLQLETILYPASALALYARPKAPQTRKSDMPEFAVAPIDAAQTERYAVAAGDDNRLHSDANFARSLGLDGPIVHGMLIMGLLPRALSTWCSSARVERLSTMFICPVPVGSGLFIGGRITPAPDPAGQHRRIARLFARTDRDQFACLGEAVLTVDPSAQSA